MQATALLAVTIVIAFIFAVVIGMWWFIAVPIAILLLLVVLGWGVLSAGRHVGEDSSALSDAPSNRQPPHPPVVAPSESDTTPHGFPR